MTTIHRATNRLHYLNSSIEVVQSLPAGGTPPYLEGGAPMPVAVYNPMRASSLANSYVNIITPGTYDAAPGVAPTWAAGTGWALNGTTQYLTTGIIPTSSYSMLVRFSDGSVVGDRCVAGSLTTGKRFYAFSAVSSNNTHRYGAGGGSEVSVAGVVATGVMAIGGLTGYLNGTPEAAGSGSFVAGLAPFIGALNNGGSPALRFSGNILYVVIWGASTDHATWMPAVSAAVAAL